MDPETTNQAHQTMSRLPTYLIAGAMRSGTTSLNAYLREHPDVFVARLKEVHFFDQNFHRGIEWYQEHFTEAGDSIAVGEASPAYLYDPDAAERIATTLPDVKILLLLRDPVTRAHSHYWHNRSVGRERMTFEDALAAEDSRMARNDRDRWRYSYADRGRYARQIENMLAHIPKERILVQTFDELTTDPVTLYRRTCRFIEVSEDFLPENLGVVTNAYVEYRSTELRDRTKKLPRKIRNAIALLNRKSTDRYDEPSEAAIRQVRDKTAEDNRLLEDLIGISVPWLESDGSQEG